MKYKLSPNEKEKIIELVQQNDIKYKYYRHLKSLLLEINGKYKQQPNQPYKIDSLCVKFD